MSHLKERSQKNCLNCNAQVQGRYCHICGQENVEIYETAWQMVTHFVQDILHYDGRFFSSIRYLLTRPGFLSKEYMSGRRASYLHPIRMYIFTSAVFFIIFFSISDADKGPMVTKYNGKSAFEIDQMDSLSFAQFTKQLNDGLPMTREQFVIYKDTLSKGKGINFVKNLYKSRAEYDSLLKSGKKDDNWLQRTFIYKEIEISEKYNNDMQSILSSLKSKLLHSFPQLLFLSLPFFALILKLLYFRHKSYFYVSHAVFGIHFYVFLFLIFLIIIGLSNLGDLLHTGFFNYLTGILIVYIFYYQYRSMRVFYEQGRSKSLLKFILLNLAHMFVLILLLIFFIFFSLMKL